MARIGLVRIRLVRIRLGGIRGSPPPGRPPEKFGRGAHPPESGFPAAAGFCFVTADSMPCALSRSDRGGTTIFNPTSRTREILTGFPRW